MYKSVCIFRENILIKDNIPLFYCTPKSSVFYTNQPNNLQKYKDSLLKNETLCFYKSFN